MSAGGGSFGKINELDGMWCHFENEHVVGRARFGKL